MGSSANQRSISVSGATYARLRKHCDSQGIPMRQLIERLTKDIPEIPGSLGTQPA